jgi:hypothetical protein
MAGFPTRPSLGAFGPTLVNRSRVVDPSKDAGADLLNLLRWQTAGLGQTAPQAWLLATFTAPSTIAAVSQGNSWQGPKPAVDRLSAGLYVVTYAATNPDELGNSIQTSLLAAMVIPRANSPRLRADWDIDGGRVITVNLFDKNDTPSDGSFLLVAF